MYVYFQNDKFEETTVRQHPWSVSEDNPDEAYCDFKAHPEAIEAILLSFQPWSKYPSTQEFYRMIQWLNGDQSPFETNDARFSGPSPNNQFDLCQKKLVCSGGVMVFYRELTWNISPDSASWILRRLAGFRHEMRPSDMISWLTGHSRSKLEKSGEGVAGWVELSHFPT